VNTMVFAIAPAAAHSFIAIVLVLLVGITVLKSARH
jgi:hypothetical protein